MATSAPPCPTHARSVRRGRCECAQGCSGDARCAHTCPLAAQCRGCCRGDGLSHQGRQRGPSGRDGAKDVLSGASQVAIRRMMCDVMAGRSAASAPMRPLSACSRRRPQRGAVDCLLDALCARGMSVDASVVLEAMHNAAHEPSVRGSARWWRRWCAAATRARRLESSRRTWSTRKCERLSVHPADERGNGSMRWRCSPRHCPRR